MKEEFEGLFADLHSIKTGVDREVLACLSEVEPKSVRDILLYYAHEGKRHLPWFTVLSAECLGGNRKRALKCAALLEILHKISLMVDDIIDRHESRKGRSTPAVVFGEREVILAQVSGTIFALKKLEADAGQEIFSDVCSGLEAVSGGVLSELNELKGGNDRTVAKEHYRVNKKFFEMFTEAGIALWPSGNINSQCKRALLHYSEKMAEMATIYDDAEDIMIDLKNGKLKRLLHILGRFSIGRRISMMTEAEVKRMMMRGDGYGKMSRKIDLLADKAVRSLASLPDTAAKSHLVSLALFMKELHKEQKDMEIQEHIEKLFSGMAKGKK